MAEDRVYLFSDNEYFYEGNGNHIRRERLEETTGYAYDGRNRLTEISYPSALGGYTEKLGYDAAGNRIRRETEQEITTYRYDNCNRLQELRREYKNTETSTAQPQIIRYTYDRQGNMLSEGEKKYSYDSFGRMVRAEVPVEHRTASNKTDEHAGFSNAAQSTYQNPVNHPVMSSIERSVRKTVEGGQIVNYKVTPIYQGNNLIPSGITIQAQGNGGLNIFQTILNRK